MNILIICEDITCDFYINIVNWIEKQQKKIIIEI